MASLPGSPLLESFIATVAMEDRVFPFPLHRRSLRLGTLGAIQRCRMSSPRFRALGAGSSVKNIQCGVDLRFKTMTVNDWEKDRHANPCTPAAAVVSDAVHSGSKLAALR